MNLYDLSIGEDKMNQFLSIALKTHFESLKVGGKGENYWQCYQAFLKYCDIYGDCDLKDLFNNKLLRQDIVCAYSALTVCTRGYMVSFLPTTQMRL